MSIIAYTLSMETKSAMPTKQKKNNKIKHEFVEFVPESRQEHVVYISIPYATAVHNCFCGCGNKVVTPLSPTDWVLSFDGVSVSFKPSIGNWSFECKSHYWIEKNTVIWATEWSKEKIDKVRMYDRSAKATFYGEQDNPSEKTEASDKTNWLTKLAKKRKK